MELVIKQEVIILDRPIVDSSLSDRRPRYISQVVALGNSLSLRSSPSIYICSLRSSPSVALSLKSSPSIYICSLRSSSSVTLSLKSSPSIYLSQVVALGNSLSLSGRRLHYFLLVSRFINCITV